MRALALDLGGTMLKIALVNEKGQIEHFQEVASNGSDGGESLLRTAFAIADGYSGYDCVGISTAGQINVETGEVIYANQNIPEYTGTNIKYLFSKRYSCPAAVENDVNAAALGEAVFGAGKDLDKFLCATYGTGIGGGIVLDKQVYHGADGVAGEIGHIILYPNGRPCNCGQCGCYEQYASARALVAAAHERDATITDGRLLFQKFAQHRDLINHWIEDVALGLVTMIHILNPNGVVLGGGIMNEDYILDRLKETVYPKLMVSYSMLHIRRAQFGNQAGLLGAAYLAIRQGKTIE